MDSTILNASFDDQKIWNIFKEKDDLSLFYGKMGACIYYYCLQNGQSKSLSMKFADELIEQIYEKINEHMLVGIEQGIAGIALGTNFLIKYAYVKGNPDIVLEEIDNLIYKTIAYDENRNIINLNEFCEILYYLSIRLEQKYKDATNQHLFTELSIKIIDHIYMSRDMSFYKEPLPYNIHFLLANYLFVTNRFFHLGIHRKRIYKIWQEMRPFIFCQIPYLQANRLLLMYAVQQISNTLQENDWKEYSNLLRTQFSLDNLLNNELKDKNIFFSDGLSGIYLILNFYNSISPSPIHIDYQYIYNKIMSSSIWEHLNETYLLNRIGLDGFFGVKLLLPYLKTKCMHYEK